MKLYYRNPAFVVFTVLVNVGGSCLLVQ